MTDIEWARNPDGTKGKVWNPVIGCSMASEGCANCYAMKFAHRGLSERHRGLTVLGQHGPRWTGEVRLVPEALATPLKWRKPQVVFVNSMSDLFHEKVPFEFIAAVFGVMAATPQHTYIVLTKRDPREFFSRVDTEFGADYVVQGHAYKLLGDKFPLHPVKGTVKKYPWPLQNVVLGVSVESADYLHRVEWLLQTPAATRIVSAEPLLGPIDFTPFLTGGVHLDAIIVGGES